MHLQYWVFPSSSYHQKNICEFLKPTPDVIFLDSMNIQLQPNNNNCGLFALACATELVHKCDPVLCNWDNILKMRQHLLVSLENSCIICFPSTKQRRTKLGNRVRKSTKETVYCSCHMPNDKCKPMITCD